MGRTFARAVACGVLVAAPLPALAQQPVGVESVPRVSLAEAAAEARARAAGVSRSQREAATAHFKLDAVGRVVPDVRAAAAIVFNPHTGEVLFESNSREARPIASLTKLMTAVTLMADAPDLSRIVRVTREDVHRASITYLRWGDELSIDTLLHLMLVASDNGAARVLARTAAGGAEAFITRMNAMAGYLGLDDSHFADPSGLDAGNTASAFDISQLVAFATSDQHLGPILRTAEYQARTTKRRFTVRSTNKLLGTEVDIVAGKTGYIRRAGYCLATLTRVPQGSQFAIVVLGATSSAVRFWEARHLFRWASEETQALVASTFGRSLAQ